MGQRVSVDADAVELRDFLRLGQQAGGALTTPRPQASGKEVPACGGSTATGHHIKAWKFDSWGRDVVDAPLDFGCDDRGLLRAEVQKNSSYLILHVQPQPQQQPPSEEDPPKTAAVAQTAAVEEFASSASASCTPRGLAVEVASRVVGAGEAPRPRQQPARQQPPWAGESAGGGSGGGAVAAAVIRYAVFVWHGLAVDPHVKAHAMAKALELDRALQRGLLGQPGVWQSLRRSVQIQGVAWPPRKEVAGDEQQRDSLRHGRNRLLSSILEAPSPGAPHQAAAAAAAAAAADPASPRQTASAGGCGPRFPRLGLSVCRSLGLALPSGSRLRDPRCTPSSSPPPASATAPSAAPPPAAPAAPSAAPSAAAARPAAGSAAGTTRVGKGIVIPRLALGGLPGPSTTAAAPLLGSEAMDVDAGAADGGGGLRDHPYDGGSGRKRYRSPDRAPCTPPQPPPVSARGPAAAAAAAVPALPLRPVSAGPPSGAGAAAAVLTSRAEPCSSSSSPVRQKGATPMLSLMAAGGGGGQRSASGGMLSLEGLHRSEEELVRSYDPDNDENNYHLPHHLYKELKLKHFRAICSEVVQGQLFLSSYQVASDLDSLKRQQITHVVNTAADICDNCFPEHFQYLTYYLKDINSEDISPLFYRTLEWIQAALDAGGRVLVHCREGVSRSATMVIAYMMWRFSLPFDAAHERVRKARPVANPNTGFTCQLLHLGRRLNAAVAATAAGQKRPEQADDKPTLHRVSPYHPKEPFLLLRPADWPSALPIFDPRFAYAVLHGSSLLLWLGREVADPQAAREAACQHLRWLETFERRRCSLSVVADGRETTEFWQALRLAGAAPSPAEAGDRAAAPPPLAARRPALDADFQATLGRPGGRPLLAAAPAAAVGAAAAAAPPLLPAAVSRSSSTSSSSLEDDDPDPDDSPAHLRGAEPCAARVRVAGAARGGSGEALRMALPPSVLPLSAAAAVSPAATAPAAAAGGGSAAAGGPPETPRQRCGAAAEGQLRMQIPGLALSAAGLLR